MKGARTALANLAAGFGVANVAGTSRVIRVRPDYAQCPAAATAPASVNRRALRITQHCS